MIIRYLSILAILGIISCTQPSVVNHGEGPVLSEQDSSFPELKQTFPVVPVFEGDLFLVFAHADDELLTFSYVAEVKRLYPKKAIHWILVSDSSQGRMMPFSCKRMSASKCRAKEAGKAATCIGIEKPYLMNLHDGKLASIKDLDKKIHRVIEKLKVNRVGAVLSSDITGVYGHPDHLAVHDAIQKLTREHKWPMLSNAIPKAFREKISLQKEAQGRTDPPITHIQDLNDDLKKKLVCAYNAHRSQLVIIWLMNQMKTPSGYFKKVPRQFFNLNLNQDNP